jgi:tight adherence protein B
MWRRTAPSDLTPVDLLVVRAALSAGALPVEALCQVQAPVLGALRASLRTGTPLTTAMVQAGPLPPAAAGLVRTMAMADAVGAPAGTAVEAVLAGVSASSRLIALIRTRSAEALMSARLLIGMPVFAAAALAVLDDGARAFMTGTLGVVLVGAALAMIGVAACWMRWLLRRIACAGSTADPLVGPRSAAGPVAPEHPGGLPTVEALGLVAMGLSAGVGLAESCRLSSSLVAPGMRDVLEGIARSLAAGNAPSRALPPQLAELAHLIDVTERFGAPTAEALRVLADDIRDRAAAAAEAAAERLTVQLVFPTTLLLVPAFGLLVVAPTLASSLGGPGPGL